MSSFLIHVLLVESSSTEPSQSTNSQTDSRTSESKTEQPKRPLSKAAGMGNEQPDNQTLLRLLEDREHLHSMFRCARVQGLDTIEGLLLFGMSIMSKSCRTQV